MRKVEVGDKICITHVSETGKSIFQIGMIGKVITIDEDGDPWAKFGHRADTLCVQQGFECYKIQGVPNES